MVKVLQKQIYIAFTDSLKHSQTFSRHCLENSNQYYFHGRIIFFTQVNDLKARNWYENEAIKETWSVRALQRNVSSQYYYRLLKSKRKDLAEKKWKKKQSLIKMINWNL